MIVQGFFIRVDLTVAHSREGCEGAIQLVYVTQGGRLVLSVECDRKGCTPGVFRANILSDENED